MADQTDSEFYAHRIAARNLAALERLSTRLRVLERQLSELRENLQRQIDLQQYKPGIVQRAA